MSRFETCLSHILEHEGGYVDHPADPGGATNMGITRRTLAAWRNIANWADLPKSAVRDLKRAEAAEIYKANYWLKCGAHHLPAGLDLALFDFAVNSGPARAVKYFQAQIGVEADGEFGPLTLQAVADCLRRNRAEDLIKTLCANRLRFLRGLSTFSTFGRGWTSRVEAVLSQALRDAATSQNQNSTRREPMNVLSGYKTYIVAASMLIAGLAQVAGVDLPGFSDQSAMQLIMEALAVTFLRRGITSTQSG